MTALRTCVQQMGDPFIAEHATGEEKKERDQNEDGDEDEEYDSD